jgi:hypothetical protein
MKDAKRIKRQNWQIILIFLFCLAAIYLALNQRVQSLTPEQECTMLCKPDSGTVVWHNERPVSAWRSKMQTFHCKCIPILKERVFTK